MAHVMNTNLYAGINEVEMMGCEIHGVVFFARPQNFSAVKMHPAARHVSQLMMD